MQRLFSRSFVTSAQVIAQTNSNFIPVYAKQKIAFDHGKGVWLYDLEGRKFLDLAAGVAVNSLGHADPDFVAAITSQAPKLVHVSNIFYNQPAAELAEQLCQSSFAKSVFFCNSGTEANEGAMKFARKYTRQHHPDKVNYVSFVGGFHGRTLGSLSLTANGKYQDPFRPLIPGVSHVKLNDVPAIKDVVNQLTSAVIVEPIQGEGGINSTTKEFIQELRFYCDKHDAVLIFDEIQCGMGRTGKLWAHEHFDVVPDIMTVAKALGNGFPIGAILVNEKVTNALKFGDHGSTFAGQPLACTVGKAVFNKINNPDMLQHVTKTGNYFRHKLENLNSPLIREVKGRGLILGVDIDLERAQLSELSPIVQGIAEEGVIILTAGGSVLRIVPPLIITEEEVDLAVAAIDKVLSRFPKQA